MVYPHNYRSKLESIFSQGCTVWNGSCIVECRRALSWVVRTVKAIVGDLDCVDDIHQRRQNSPSTSSVCSPTIREEEPYFKNLEQ